MKKIMIAAFAVAFAAISQAATVSWSVTGVNASPAAGAFTGYNAYLVDVQAMTLADLSTALAGGDMTVLDKAVAEGALKGTTTGAISKTITDGYDKGTTDVSYYTVIVDEAAKWFIATSVVTGDVTGTGTYSAKFGNQTTAGNTTWTEIAPEPTSGLMMLLGMGVLALRRRRA